MTTREKRRLERIAVREMKEAALRPQRLPRRMTCAGCPDDRYKLCRETNGAWLCDQCREG